MEEGDNEKNDKCLVCGVETPYAVNVPIDCREHYVECAGQLCAKCYQETFPIGFVFD